MQIALYELTSQYHALAERLADMDLDAQTIHDTIEASGLSDALQEKAQGIEMVARAAEMHCPAIDLEIARLQALKDRRQRIAQGVREYLRSNMEGAGIERIDCPFFRVSLKKNPPAVEIFDENIVPEHLWVMPEPKPPEKRLDKKAIAASIKAKIEVPGARLVQKTRLEII